MRSKNLSRLRSLINPLKSAIKGPIFPRMVNKKLLIFQAKKTKNGSKSPLPQR